MGNGDAYIDIEMQRNLLIIYLKLPDGRGFARVRVRSLGRRRSMTPARFSGHRSLPPIVGEDGF